MTLSKLILGISTLALLSCGDKKAKVPAYISIDHIDLETTSKEGSNLHKITDVWLTLNGLYIGTYELPCKVPVLKYGKQKLTLRAGILMNGIYATRSAYTVFDLAQGVDLDGNDIDEITLTADSVTYLNAKVKYKDDIEVRIIEDYETAGDSFESIELKDVTTPDTAIYSADYVETTDVDLVYEGKTSGMIKLTEEKHTILLTLNEDDPLDVPKQGFNYMEVDYKTDVDLTFGLWFNDPQKTQAPRHGLRPTDEWKKVYLHIIPEQVNNSASPIQATKYRPYMLAKLPSGMKEGYIYLDNIKVIHENE